MEAVTYTIKEGCDDCGCGLLCVAGMQGGSEGRDANCPRVYRERIDLATREEIPTPPRPTQRAAQLVDGDRQDAYGHPLPNHERIAAFWTVRLAEKLKQGEIVEPHDVAALMRLAKESRLMQTPGHNDSLVDLAGYADVEHGIHDGYRRFWPESFLSRLFGFRRSAV